MKNLGEQKQVTADDSCLLIVSLPGDHFEDEGLNRFRPHSNLFTHTPRDLAKIKPYNAKL